MTTYSTRGIPFVESTDSADLVARINPIAQLVHDRPGIQPYTTAERDALTGTSLWDGRLIVNITTDRVQRYDLGTTSWVSIAEPSEIPGLLATTGLPLQDEATTAGNRGTASFAARSDHVHPRSDTGWIAPTLMNNWANYGSTWEVTGYRRIDGRVHLRGLLNGASRTSAQIFALPTGYRPLKDHSTIAVCSTGFAYLNVYNDGSVSQNTPAGAIGWWSLANISFPV